jgi:hypothetical protein
MIDDYKSRTISWDLPKQSYLCRVTLEFLYSYTAASAANDHMTPLGLLNCIDSIELLSSGRRIQEFSREVILAKMSDNPSHIGKAYRVRFTDGDIGRTWHADGHYDMVFAGIAIKDAKLICEYRQLAASDADAVVQASFGSGQMASLISMHTFAKAVHGIWPPPLTLLVISYPLIHGMSTCTVRNAEGYI